MNARDESSRRRAEARPAPRPDEPQLAARLLLIRPACFAANAQTAASNAFQESGFRPADPAQQARAEFDGLVRVLDAAGIDALVIEDTPEPCKPDALFPNNWVSFHADGTVVLYPMEAPNRRAEVRLDVVQEVERRAGFVRRRLLDLRAGADVAGFLEGTGSLVLDRPGRRAFACLSSRTHPAQLERFCDEMGYVATTFRALDASGTAIYHTNVMLSVGERVAVLCAESIRDPVERSSVRAALRESGRELVEIDPGQMAGFAANLLQVRARDGQPRLVLSERARRAFRPEQVRVLERHGALVSAPLATIEAIGGGSARCMLAEVFGSAQPAADGP